MSTWDRRHTLLVITIIVNFIALVASTSMYEPPRLNAQREKVIEVFIISSIPLLWTLYLILWGHGRFPFVVGLINLLPAFGWLFFALRLVAKAFY
jgi:hypothetical protein